MRRANQVKSNVDDHPGDAPMPPPFDQSDLLEWSARGGPLPKRLARHIESCAGCADRVRRVSQVHASLTILRTRPVPAGLYARANSRALRMLRRAARASAAARRLLAVRPNLSPWQRAQLQIARVTLGAAAALLILVMRAGVLTAVEETRAVGKQLAGIHWDRHIDPDHEWLDPPHMA